MGGMTRADNNIGVRQIGSGETPAEKIKNGLKKRGRGDIITGAGDKCVQCLYQPAAL